MERLFNSDIKLELIVHAEQNAIIAAGSRSEGGVLYVWGKPICARCAGSIVQAGIKRIVAPSPESLSVESKWYQTGRYAQQMFAEVGIQADFYVDSERS